MNLLKISLQIKGFTVAMPASHENDYSGKHESVFRRVSASILLPFKIRFSFLREGRNPLYHIFCPEKLRKLLPLGLEVCLSV